MRATFAPGLAFALALAACGNAEEAGRTEALAPSDRTVAAALEATDRLDRTGALVRTAGLQQALDGIGPYTIFAPLDDAYAALGEAGDALGGDAAQSGALAASLLRGHIVPGLLTDRDIVNAIEVNGGEVEMTTMDDTILTFRDDRDGIVVTTRDGARARLLPGTEVARNGAVHPIDGLLRNAGESGSGAR
ncbi:fasciclin domain-containing protein [Stakelama tenebrarum]|uniref:Fasciclin domain-containing protein n=1 Tax=Stakelama tenebrarum TaxID=2711215 RepID=A0A6G6Y6Q7_9SPHN|nr:fasciclin domain-containing protein [Sphingosinithalassobacter tenebrarum]QIG80600.1 fasciclin domain-containing protein [Sphingosinithalassobacter tenebrarum]